MNLTVTPNVTRLRLYHALLIMLQQHRGGIRHSRSKGHYIYNVNGRRVPERTIQNKLNTVVKDFQGNANKLADRLDKGGLNTAQWQDRMRREIKDLHRTQYIVGKGGVGNMTPHDWGRLGADLKNVQYKALDNFALDIAEGNLSPAQIKARSRIYMNASKKQYRRGKASAAGFIEDAPFFVWQRGSTKDPCSDCLRLDGEVKTLAEWEEAGIEPQSPDLECGGWNCQCQLVQV